MKLSNSIMTLSILWMLSCQPEAVQPVKEKSDPDPVSNAVKYEVARGALTVKTIKFKAREKGVAGAREGATCIVDGIIVDDCPFGVELPGGGTGGSADNYKNVYP